MLEPSSSLYIFVRREAGRNRIPIQLFSGSVGLSSDYNRFRGSLRASIAVPATGLMDLGSAV